MAHHPHRYKHINNTFHRESYILFSMKVYFMLIQVHIMVILKKGIMSISIAFEESDQLVLKSRDDVLLKG